MVTTTITEIVPIKMNKDGVILVSQTRVTLDTIVSAFNEGATAEEIAYQYPSVPLADIYSVIAYYLRRKSLFEKTGKTGIGSKETERRAF